MSDLRIGLLQCGHLHTDLQPDYGDYPEIFSALLGSHGVEIATWDVTSGPPPDATDACDGWLVSGSARSTYDPLPWIPPVEQFLRDVVADQAPLVAICFGHQLLAQAHGGRVARAGAGWGVGAHEYHFLTAEGWMEPPHEAPIRLVASHQDQVVELPDGAQVIARTDHCPIAAYTLGPAALAIQPHPEFSTAVSRDLIERRRELIGAERSDDALASLDRPLDQAIVAAWIASFLRDTAR
ncbi:MAG: synthase [Acidimicrobiales bacterium]|nr:synthase [Acidimicrobiales bacterium]